MAISGAKKLSQCRLAWLKLQLLKDHLRLLTDPHIKMSTF